MGHETTSLKQDHLQMIKHDAQRNAARVRELFEALTFDQLTWKPDPKTWSIAECIEHLTLTDGNYIPRLTDAIEIASRKGKVKRAPYQMGFTGKLFVWLAGEKKNVKIKSIALFKPEVVVEGGNIRAGKHFLAGQSKMLELIRRADDVNINEVKLTSPVSGMIRFTIGDALTFLIDHQKRHIAQAEKLIEREGFPTAT